jgi:hypothetical protein
MRIRRLVLAKETLGALTNDDLRGVAAGNVAKVPTNWDDALCTAISRAMDHCPFSQVCTKTC